jgi:hypothetical protein
MNLIKQLKKIKLMVDSVFCIQMVIHKPGSALCRSFAASVDRFDIESSNESTKTIYRADNLILKLQHAICHQSKHY